MTDTLPSRMQTFVEYINSADPAIGASIISPEALFHVPFSDSALQGLAGYEHVLGMMRGGFSDIQWTLEETIIEGDAVAARFTLRGTHDGAFFGVPATGTAVVAAAVNLYRFHDGLIVGERGMPDLLAILTQIGAVPDPAAS
ncbi:ester cyclase [Rathayibacter sp. VKM Ac-2760]|uniref:ester cyclase n=1 Tax=Rathayibacter sp. VKM Ac-2760 TaxID=2609253 RepID=UPI0013178F56|nr:ester cyclase [Rathayibacter sp. VKM Ac-2760]QHC57809.1 ester cyclase [Rathayibacter sp. VKM Ac-2760]